MPHLPERLPPVHLSAEPSAPLRFAAYPERPRPRSAVKPHLVTSTFRLEGVLGIEAFVKLPCEDEDARLTGATRSLDRRRLGLNVAGSLRGVSLKARSVTVGALPGTKIA